MKIASHHGKIGSAEGIASCALLAALFLTGTGIGMIVEAALKGEAAVAQADNTKKADTERIAEGELFLKAGAAAVANNGSSGKGANGSLFWDDELESMAARRKI